MSEGTFTDEELEVVRSELASVRARQEVLADALAIATIELEQTQALREELVAARQAIIDLNHSYARELETATYLRATVHELRGELAECRKDYQ